MCVFCQIFSYKIGTESTKVKFLKTVVAPGVYFYIAWYLGGNYNNVLIADKFMLFERVLPIALGTYLISNLGTVLT